MNNKLIEDAYERLRNIVNKTPLELNKRLSEKYKARIYLKREDLQVVRSYKLRGAYNRMSLLNSKEKLRGVVCASAGNHAQGVALSCEKLRVKGSIYMPENTPKQKVERVKALGGKWITIHLLGKTFDEAYAMAKDYSDKSKKIFIHPFDDKYVIAGQGTVGVEIFAQLKERVDYLIIPVGGGGLLSGLGFYARSKNKNCKIIGVEPLGAPSMSKAFKNKKVVTLKSIDKFVDGAAVKTVGNLNYQISKDLLNKILLVPEGRVCQEMIYLYQSDGIISEPAGALSVASLDMLKNEIKGKTVVCIISGGNNDISRYPEIIERSLVYQGLKHYFIIEFTQKPGELRSYLDKVLGKNDDITLFEYIKKNNRETGPSLVGIELLNKKDLKPLLKRMDKIGLSYELLKSDSSIFKFLI